MKKRALLYIAAMAGVAAVGVGMGGGEVSAASVTLNPGDDIGAAVTQAVAGDTITFNPGTYTLTRSIILTNKQNVSLVGADGAEVILRYDGNTVAPGTRQAIQLMGSRNITLTNLSIEASSTANEGDWGTASSGVGINASCDVALQDLDISGFGRAAVMVTRSVDTNPTPCPSGNITFDALTATGNNYGILFNNRAEGAAGDINGVIFEGVNTITGGNYGIMTDAASSVAKVTGPNGSVLNMGTVDISAANSTILLRPGNRGQVAMDSRLNGRLVSEMTYKYFCDLVGAWILPDAPCVGVGDDAVAVMEGYNCSCDPTQPNSPNNPCLDPGSQCEIDETCNEECPEGYMPEGDDCVPVPCGPEDPNYPCIDVSPSVPQTGFVTGVESLMGSPMVWIVGIGGGVVMGAVLIVGWARRQHRIKM